MPESEKTPSRLHSRLKAIFSSPLTPSEIRTGKKSLNLFERFPEPRADIKILAACKDSDDVNDSEDAAAISQDGTRIAISDGVSQSSIPGPWARALALNWVEAPNNGMVPTNELLNKSKEDWEHFLKVDWPPHVRKNRKRLGIAPLAEGEAESIAQNVMERGASATFLGVQIDPEDKKINAVALGDTCLFLVSSNDGSYTSFPLTESSQFTSRPQQISTKMDDVNATAVQQESFDYEEGDYLVLATDAVAKWYMNLLNDSMGLAKQFLKTDSQEFAGFVKGEQNSGAMETDDSTAIIMKLPGSTKT